MLVIVRAFKSNKRHSATDLGSAVNACLLQYLVEDYTALQAT